MKDARKEGRNEGGGLEKKEGGRKFRESKEGGGNEGMKDARKEGRNEGGGVGKKGGREKIQGE